MNRLAAIARVHLFDVLVVVVAVGMQVDIWLSSRTDEPLFAVFSLLAPAALLLRRAFPFAAPVAALVGLGATTIVDAQAAYDSGLMFFAAILTAWALGTVPDARKAAAGLGGLYVLDAVVTHEFPGQALGDYFWIAVVFTTAWGVGFVYSKRLAQAQAAEARLRELAESRDEEARRAVAEERQRIARELHDVVAHSISVMTVQAGGVRRLLREDQEREREALLAVEETGREALAEMRRLLGMLKGANETPALAPQPSLANVDNLVRQVREAGLPCELRVEGEPSDLPPGVDLSAYRIVQEALTNALKYAGPARARVRVDYGPDDVVIEVANDGSGEPGGDGDGNGIAGMRERVAVFGGTLQCGPRDDGSGYVVRARLPIAEKEKA